MGIKTTETFIARSALLYVYKCEHCGNVNSVMQKVSASSTINARSEFLGPSLEEKERYAKTNAGISLDLKMEKIHKDVANGDYSSARFGCKCNKCKKKPVWASLFNNKLEIIFKISTYLSVMAILFSLLSLLEGVGEWLAVLPHLVMPPVAITLALFIIKKVIFSLNTKKSSKLASEFRPILCNTMTEVGEAIKKLGGSINSAESN